MLLKPNESKTHFSNYKYFFKHNFIDTVNYSNLENEILNFNDSSEIIINKNGEINTNIYQTNHIRDFTLDDSVIDSLLTPSIKNIKNAIKNTLKDGGVKNPKVVGIQNYKNPNDHPWHKDFVSTEMSIHPLKRWITFYFLSVDKSNGTFIVAPDHPVPGNITFGFKLTVESNLLIGHNQYLGHAYKKNNTKNINIFSILWYDL